MKLTKKHEVEINQILEDYMRLWKEGRSDACADLYEASGDTLGVDGHFFRGRDEIKEYYDNVMAGKYSGLEVRDLQTIGIRYLGQGVALLDATWEIYAASDDEASSTVVASFVVVHTNNVWKISACRMMVPMAAVE